MKALPLAGARVPTEIDGSVGTRPGCWRLYATERTAACRVERRTRAGERHPGLARWLGRREPPLP
jgi:hypothetical protein